MKYPLITISLPLAAVCAIFGDTAKTVFFSALLLAGWMELIRDGGK